MRLTTGQLFALYWTTNKPLFNTRVVVYSINRFLAQNVGGGRDENAISTCISLYTKKSDFWRNLNKIYDSKKYVLGMLHIM